VAIRSTFVPQAGQARRSVNKMYPRPAILLEVEKTLGKQCLFVELREVVSFYPQDKRLLFLAKRLHNYMTIRHDFRKANDLIGEVIKAQQIHKTKLHPYLYSAGFFHAIILYSRWFKATEKRPKLDVSHYMHDPVLLEKHEHVVEELRDRYIAHYELELMGQTELYLTYETTGEFLEISPVMAEIFLSSKADMYDLSKLIEVVHNKINTDIVPKYKTEVIEYLHTLPDFDRVCEMAKPRNEIVEPINNPYT